MTSKDYIIGLVIVLIAGILSCSKDEPIPDPNADPECYSFESHDGISNSVFILESIQYKAPSCNPLNSDEFVYFYRNYSTGEGKLVKYNFLTGMKSILVDTFDLISQPTWSRSGWIAYDKAGEYKIWVVKDDGDSLHRFSDTGGDLYPSWDSSGKEIYWMHSPNLAIPYYGFRKPLYNSNQEDTVYSSFLSDMQSSNNNDLLSQIYVGSTPFIAKTTLGTNFSFSPLINLYQVGEGRLNGICWHPNGQDFYFTIHGVGMFKGNANTGQYIKIMDFCHSKIYNKISCTPNGQFLIGERIKYWVSNPDDAFWEIRVQSNIYRINLATMEETLIDLD